jgi:hypothetical protein
MAARSRTVETNPCEAEMPDLGSTIASARPRESTR